MKALLASILAATLSSAALSATISFPNNPLLTGAGGVVAENFVDTGFRFSPSCHLALIGIALVGLAFIRRSVVSIA